MSIFISEAIQDLRERVHRLDLLEPANEIQVYCDEIESETLLSFDSAIEHLIKLKDELLTEITSYRNGRLQAQVSENRSDEWKMIRNELADLGKQTEKLLSLDLLQLQNKTNEVADTKKQTDEYRKKAIELGRRMRDEIFGGRFMSFEPNNVFNIQADHLGKIQYRGREPQTDFDGKEIIKKQPDFELDSISTTNAIQNVLGEFTCFGYADGTIGLFDMRTSEYAHRIKIAKSAILSMTDLMDGMLAVGCEDGTLYVTGLKRLPTSKFSGHSSAVFSVKRLKERTFASMSTDNTIKIWTYLLADPKHKLLATIYGHGCTKTYSQLGVLSNYYLVTCSDDLQNGIIRIWDPYNGKMAREFESKVGEVVALTVLSNDDIVVGSKNGTIRVISLYDEGLSKTLIGPREKIGISGVSEIKGGFLIASESSQQPNLQVWDPRSGKLLQSMPSEHKECIRCLYVTSIKLTIVTSSTDSIIKIWNVALDATE